MLSGTILLIGPPLESEGYKEITCPAFLFLLYPEPRLLKITSFKEAEHLIDKLADRRNNQFKFCLIIK